jgi:ATP-dependent Clp protease protease subunit
MNNSVKDVYMMFCGGIDQAAAQRIMNGINIASQQKQNVHLLLQSTGGLIGDGVCLYNYLRGCPADVALYNVGTVSSIAIVAYLGATARVANQYSTFMIHSATAPAVPMNTVNIEAAAKSLNIDDERIKKILESHIAIDDGQWSHLRHHELWFTAPDAVKSGIATIIGDFSPPKGSPVYTL